MTGLSNEVLMPPLLFISSFQALMCSSNRGWQTDGRRERASVRVCQIALAFL